ncbi:hypothetical protein CEUSTIGMA_g4052.t1 [Chlamydomonas eustigma]|uniref:Uncharacterized protein n=1 Tax=Chlamydomonas eustigma TaxID=1157962 RepID=A0A250X0M9_9CHLO|nr:hypothetical protein CEUSTIGMA_g4052.t1 [Chlamydomonas eustigma]|eukprot:GAX76606.1 hypothetical protein CEUSTIGMA_g4052.t1 [Chlamydomonas eustigma]
MKTSLGRYRNPHPFLENVTVKPWVLRPFMQRRWCGAKDNSSVCVASKSTLSSKGRLYFRRVQTRSHPVMTVAMVNVDFASPSLVLGAALIGCGVLLLQMRNMQTQISRDADIVVAAMVSIVGSTLIFQGWRLDPLLLLCQALTTSVAFWYGLEAFRLRSKASMEEQSLLPPPEASSSNMMSGYPPQQQQQQQAPFTSTAPPQAYAPPSAPNVYNQQYTSTSYPPPAGFIPNGGYLPPALEDQAGYYAWLTGQQQPQDSAAAASYSWGQPAPGTAAAGTSRGSLVMMGEPATDSMIRYDYFGNTQDEVLYQSSSGLAPQPGLQDDQYAAAVGSSYDPLPAQLYSSGASSTSSYPAMEMPPPFNQLPGQGYSVSGIRAEGPQDQYNNGVPGTWYPSSYYGSQQTSGVPPGSGNFYPDQRESEQQGTGPFPRSADVSAYGSKAEQSPHTAGLGSEMLPGSNQTSGPGQKGSVAKVRGHVRSYEEVDDWE